MFEEYRATGRMPTTPDRELCYQGPPLGPAAWAERLSPWELARMRQAIDQGARNGRVAAPWTELA